MNLRLVKFGLLMLMLHGVLKIGTIFMNKLMKISDKRSFILNNHLVLIFQRVKNGQK